MEAIKQLKELYDEGLMSKEEYDERRLQLINNMTKTDYSADAAPSPVKTETTAQLLQDDGEDRWETGAGGKDGGKPVDPLPVIMRGQRTDMPAIKEKQSDIEKVIFRAVVGNEIEVLKDLHERGADFNIYEPTAGNTPLHIACSIGMRHMAQFLVERGAMINVNNLERKDKYGKTPLDYAHPWLAGELKEIMAQRERAEAVAKGAILVTKTDKYGEQPQTLNLKAGTGMTDMKTLEESAMKRAEEKVYTDLADIYLKNMRCKEVSYLNTDTVQDVVNKAAEVFGMPEVKSHLQLFVRTGLKDAKGVLVADEPLAPQRQLTRIRTNDWPEREAYKLILQPVQGAPYNMGMRYREIMYGAEADLSTKDQFMVENPIPKKNNDEGIFGDLKKKIGKKKDDDKGKKDDKSKKKK